MTVSTAFVLTASLSADGVNREDCKKYLAIFSTATIAIAAIFRCLLQPTDGGKNDWTGIAMLISVRYLAKVARSLTELLLSQGRKFSLYPRCPPASFLQQRWWIARGWDQHEVRIGVCRGGDVYPVDLPCDIRGYPGISTVGVPRVGPEREQLQ
jgi:hypothetical protein